MGVVSPGNFNAYMHTSSEIHKFLPLQSGRVIFLEASLHSPSGMQGILYTRAPRCAATCVHADV